MAFKATPHHHTNAKAVLGFFVVLLAFGILVLFISYKDALIVSGNLETFIVLATVALALLAGLYFIATQGNVSFYKEVNVSKSHKTSRSSKSSKSKNKKRSR